MTQCDIPLSVTVAMALTVADPAAFVADQGNKRAVEQGIAVAAGVDESAVDAVLTVGSRRLQVAMRRMQDGTVNVEATVHAADAPALATLTTSLTEVDATLMTTHITTAFAANNIEGVTITVSSLADPVQAPTATEAYAAEEAAAAPATSPAPPASGESAGAFQATLASGVLMAILAMKM